MEISDDINYRILRHIIKVMRNFFELFSTVFLDTEKTKKFLMGLLIKQEKTEE
jgi:hypothetical protein